MATMLYVIALQVGHELSAAMRRQGVPACGRGWVRHGQRADGSDEALACTSTPFAERPEQCFWGFSWINPGAKKALVPCSCFPALCLQGVTRTPFRVVDEINQGLDERNEAKVSRLRMRYKCTGGWIRGRAPSEVARRALLWCASRCRCSSCWVRPAVSPTHRRRCC